MSLDRAVMARTIRDFAAALTRTPLYECGHADAWQPIQRAQTIDDLVVALAYCAGYADCARVACAWNSPAWCIGDILGTAARTLAKTLRSPASIDLHGHVATYSAELAEQLARDQTPPRVVP